MSDPFVDWSYPYLRAQKAMNNAGTAAGRYKWEEAYQEVSMAIRHLDDMRNALPVPTEPKQEIEKGGEDG